MRLIDLDGAVITIDAMGTQTAIARQIVNGKGNCVLSSKKNQGLLYQAALEFVAEHVENQPPMSLTNDWSANRRSLGMDAGNATHSI
ncbi:MAG: hypothetical protein R3C18_11580 [Planctomycetaceae bacterium]